MAILRYPIPYQIFAVPKGMKKPRAIDIAAEAAFEIPDHDEISAPLVAELQMEWPNGVFPSWLKEADNLTPIKPPKAQFRYVDRRFFSAVYITDKASHRPAKVDELEEVMDGSRECATVMSHLYALNGDEFKMRMRAQREGKLSSLDETPHFNRQVKYEVALQSHDVMLDFARQDAERYISVDGYLWRRLEQEPSLVYEVNEDKKEIVVSVEKPHRAMKAFSRNFSLSRLDDLLDHLETHYPSHDVRVALSELNVIHPEAFTLDHDAASVWKTAYDLQRRFHNELESLNEKALDAWYDLRDETQKTNQHNVAERGELLADIIRRLITQLPKKKTLDFARIELQRWDMRPVTAQSLRSIL